MQESDQLPEFVRDLRRVGRFDRDVLVKGHETISAGRHEPSDAVLLAGRRELIIKMEK